LPTVADREKWLEKFVEDYMFHDIEVCIKGNANFTVALALSVYTEVVGGLVNGSLTISGNSGRNYVTFLARIIHTCTLSHPLGQTRTRARAQAGTGKEERAHPFFKKRIENRPLGWDLNRRFDADRREELG
jgi:hypothetical protein